MDEETTEATPFAVWQVALMGAAGATLPILLDLVHILDKDALAFVEGFTVAALIGNGLRMFAYAVLGGVYCAMQYGDLKMHKPKHIFQMGVIAPMTLSAVLTAQTAPVEAAAVTPAPAESSFSIIGGVAYADASQTKNKDSDNEQQHEDSDKVTKPTHFPRQSVADSVWSHFTRKKIEMRWWVVSPEFSTEATADAYAKRIDAAYKLIDPIVMEPHDGVKGWTVVLAYDLPKATAEMILGLLQQRQDFADVRLVSYPKLHSGD